MALLTFILAFEWVKQYVENKHQVLKESSGEHIYWYNVYLSQSFFVFHL